LASYGLHMGIVTAPLCNLYPRLCEFLILHLRVLPRRFRKSKPQQYPLNPLSLLDLSDRAGIPQNLRGDPLFNTRLLCRFREEIPQKALCIGKQRIIHLVGRYVVMLRMK
jgi:hypothetical protein